MTARQSFDHGDSASRVFPAIAIVSGLLPLVGVHTAYALAVAADQVPACWIYLEGCTSVSATGRQPPASFIFRGTMMPAAVAMLAYWYLAKQWLRLHNDQSRVADVLPWMGLFASVFLVVYATVLGHVGEWYAMQRRIGVVVYFSMTLMAQLLLTHRITELLNDGRLVLPKWILRAKLALCGTMLLVGLASIPAAIWAPEVKAIERIIEWNYSLLLVLYFPVTAFAWRADGFHWRLHTR